MSYVHTDDWHVDCDSHVTNESTYCWRYGRKKGTDNMNTSALPKLEAEDRQSSRIPLQGALAYRCSEEVEGVATWCSVGAGGACIRLGHYLRPGRHLLMVTHALKTGEGPTEMSGRIVWCRPTANGRTFVAGVRIFEAGSEAILSLVAIVQQANGEESKCLAN